MHSRNALQLGLHDIYYTLEQRYITHVQGCGIYSDLHTAGKEWKLHRMYPECTTNSTKLYS